MITAHFINGPLHGRIQDDDQVMPTYTVPVLERPESGLAETLDYIYIPAYKFVCYTYYYFNKVTQEAYYRCIDGGDAEQS